MKSDLGNGKVKWKCEMENENIKMEKSNGKVKWKFNNTDFRDGNAENTELKNNM